MNFLNYKNDKKLIYEKFNNANIKITFGYINVIIKCNDFNPLISDLTSNIEFTIYRNSHIYIDYLRKCNASSGSDSLSKIIELGKEFNCEFLQLYDASSITFISCDLSLSNLNIFIYGKSWYNKKGFKSLNFENELIDNNKIINLNFEDFVIESVLQKREKTEILALEFEINTFYQNLEIKDHNDIELYHLYKLKTIKHKYDIYINNLYILYEKLINKYKIDHNTTISKIVNIVYLNIKNTEFICDSIEYDFLNTIILLANYIFNYDRNLYLYIT